MLSVDQKESRLIARALEQGVLEFKGVPVEFKAAGDQGQYEGHFSIFGNVDDGGDVVHAGAFARTIQDRGRRIKVFYAHDWEKLIGPPPDVLQEDSTGLFAKGHLTLDSFYGREAFALMKDGALTEASIGYEPVKYDYSEVPEPAPSALKSIRNLREIKLYEISPVPLGMNAMAQIRAVKSAFLAQFKAAIPPHTTAKADEGEAWDAGAVLREAEGAAKLRLIHAWVNPDGDPEVKSSYKLPHHLADGRVVWRGVAASGAAIMGSRGGVNIPEADVAGVRRHLARHYEQFDKTPPWEESAGLQTYIETLSAITTEFKTGRVLSAASRTRVDHAVEALGAALEALQELLEAAEPRQEEAHSALVRRLRWAEQALLLVGQRS